MLEKSGGQVKGLTQKKKRVGDNYADCWFGFSVSEPSFTRKNEMFEVSKVKDCELSVPPSPLLNQTSR